jgi:hypothetical protein
MNKPKNKQGSGKAQQRDGRNRTGNGNRNQRQRRTSEYDTPDNGGIVARSSTPRRVVLTFDEAETETLLMVLRDSGLIGTRDYVEDKLAWTRRYNAKLTSNR